MAFKLGSINKRAVLLSEDHYYDLETISEGDLRRSILQGQSLKAKVSQVMNKKPMFCQFWRTVILPGSEIPIVVFSCASNSGNLASKKA